MKHMSILSAAIPTGQCQRCRFYSETEDGERYCAIYDRSWEQTDNEADRGETDPPEFCKATRIFIEEKP